MSDQSIQEWMETLPAQYRTYVQGLQNQLSVKSVALSTLLREIGNHGIMVRFGRR